MSTRQKLSPLGMFLIVLVLFAASASLGHGEEVQIEKWIKRYDGGGSDLATNIAVDSEENVYVTGLCYGSGITMNYTTVAYDSSGKELWVARYYGAVDVEDEAPYIAVDSRGNVYVTGHSYGGTYYDYTTIAYKGKTGKELWVKKYDGGSIDFATAIAVDSGGNVYVTGWSYGGGTRFDYSTVAYDSSGNELWVTRYDGPLNHRDHATAIAVDSEGNVYVTGRSWGGFRPGETRWDYATIKYEQKIDPVERIIKKLIEKVDTLVDEVALIQGEANALISKLKAALESKDKGNVNAACNQLQAFIYEVNAYIYSGRLSLQEGQALIDVVTEAINELCG